MVDTCVGDTFPDLERTIEKYQKEHFVQFYKRDSRTIESSIRRATNKKYNADIKYTHVTYSCINGGKKFKESTCKMPQYHNERKLPAKYRKAESEHTLCYIHVHTLPLPV